MPLERGVPDGMKGLGRGGERKNWSSMRGSKCFTLGQFQRAQNA